MDAAHFPSGVKVTGEEKDIRSLGGLAYVPLWIFYRGEPLDDLAQLAGKRLSAGPAGGAAQMHARQLRSAVGLEAGAPFVQQLAREEGVRLLSVARAEAITRRFPALKGHQPDAHAAVPFFQPVRAEGAR